MVLIIDQLYDRKVHHVERRILLADPENVAGGKTQRMRQDHAVDSGVGAENHRPAPMDSRQCFQKGKNALPELREALAPGKGHLRGPRHPELELRRVQFLDLVVSPSFKRAKMDLP